MNAFQWVTCTTLAVVLVRDLLSLRRRSIDWKIRAVRLFVWSAAILAIADPTLVQRFANLLGIGRGADIVLYAVALAFVAVTFYFYTQQLRLQREISTLASHIARQEARRGAGPRSEPKPSVAPRET